MFHSAHEAQTVQLPKEQMWDNVGRENDLLSVPPTFPARKVRVSVCVLLQSGDSCRQTSVRW